MMCKHCISILTLMWGWAAALSAQAPHVVLVESSTDVLVSDDGSYTQHEKRAYKIADEHGAAYASMALTLSDAARLTDFSAVATDATGKVIKRWKKSDVKTTQLSAELASDATTYYMEYQPHQYPVMVAYDLTVRQTDGCLSYPVFMPQRGYGVEVLHASYQLNVPNRLGCRVKSFHTDVPVTVNDEGADRQLLRAEMTHLQAIEREPLMPSLSELLPAIYFAPTTFTFGKTSGSQATWQSLGSWLYALQQDRQTLPDALRHRLHEMTDTCTSVTSRIRQVYRLLSQTTRYVSIQFGIGGLQPFPASEVYRTGFGDCKALSNYMVAMLGEVGVEAQYVVVGTDHRRVFPDFAELGHFNHVVVMVPQPADTLWLECTNPQLPLGYVHSNIEGHVGLAVTAKGGQLVSLPTYADTLHQDKSTLDIALQSDGSATLSLTQHAYYQCYEELFPLTIKGDAERREAVAKRLHAGQLSIDQLEIIDHASEDRAELELRCEARSSTFASATGHRLFVNLSVLHHPFTLPSSSDVRLHDICIPDGQLNRVEITIRMPEGYEVESKPLPMSVSSPYGTARFSIVESDGFIRASHEWLVRRGRYPSTMWSDFQAFVKTSLLPFTQKLVLRKKE